MILMGQNIEKILRYFLNILGCYLIFDGAIHLFNIRLLSVAGIWPNSALSYATLLDTIYASFVFLAAVLIFTAQKDLKKYTNLLFASSIWALMHGFLLIYLTSSQNFTLSFWSLSSLSVWIPFYNQYLLFEALLAFIYVILVFAYLKSSKSK